MMLSACAESIILSAGGAENIILSAHAESIILSVPSAKIMILPVPPAESIILLAHERALRVSCSQCGPALRVWHFQHGTLRV
jgi:hypothetical protein